LVEHRWSPYTTTPSYCDIGVSCKSVTPVIAALPCQELDNDDPNKQTLDWTVGEDEWKNGLVPPGTYTYCYDVTVNGASPTSPADEFCIEVTFEDPCDPPTITEPASGTITYTITDDQQEKLVLAPEYTVDPSWCPFEIGIIPPTNVNLAPKTTLVEATQDVTLDPITDTLEPAGLVETTHPFKTTITTKDYSDIETTSEVDHDIVIKNPCIDPSYVTIELP
jgi:hypothetical protein